MKISYEYNLKQCKMNAIIKKFLIADDKFISKINLRQSGKASKAQNTYSACKLHTKNKEIIQNFQETLGYIYSNEQDKAYFQHNIFMVILKIYLK